MLMSQPKADVQTARGLGWASLGIAAAELAAPQQVETLLGLKNSRAQQKLVRLMGIRELMHGVSILAQGHSVARLAPAVSARVAGDILDTALLGVAGLKTRRPARFAAVAAMVLAIGALDLLCASRLAAAEK